MHEAYKRTVHQRHVGGLNGHIGTGADGEAHVGTGQRRSVVDAVPHHRDRIALPLQSGHLVGLVLRMHAGNHTGHADLTSHGLRSGLVVAGQHDDFDAM